MATDQEEETLVEEKEEEMVASIDSKQPIKRKGFFLKPISDDSSNLSFCSKFCSKLKTLETPKVHFNGWVCSLRNWDQWVTKLKPIYKDLWKAVGIFHAINASTYRFRRDPSSLFGVARFWCGRTNTFLFPWGEATITLEDVMILSGFSIIGEPVRASKPLDGELGGLESQIIREVKKFNLSKCKKADISVWMKHFMEEGDGDELEHLAFLVLWLTRFVLLAPPQRTIGYHVIPIAVRLAQGMRIALAPAVLASLCRDLRKMKDHLVSDQRPDTPLVVWAPLHILQLWIWERFSSLRPESSNFVNSHELRAARWHDAGKKLGNNFVMSVIKSSNEFQWRPYVASLDHWCKPSYITEGGGWLCNNVAVDEGMKSFAQSLRPCELVGIDCIEQYLPHRVARQFGFDQDLPHVVPRAKSNWEVAWGTFDISAKNVKFYVPSKVFKSEVTLRYSVWWTRVQRLLRKKMKGKKRKKNWSLQNCEKIKMEDVDDIPLSDLQRCKKFKVQGDDDVPLSDVQHWKEIELEDIFDVPLSDLRYSKMKRVQDINGTPLSDLQGCKKEKEQDIDDVPLSDLQLCNEEKQQYTDDIPLSELQCCKKEKEQDIDDVALSDQQCWKKEKEQHIDDVPLSDLQRCPKKKLQDIDDVPLSDLQRCQKKKLQDIDDVPLSSLQRCKKKKVQASDDIRLSGLIGKKNQTINSEHMCPNPPDLATYATAIQDHHACIKNTKISVEQKPLVEYPQIMEHDAHALINVEAKILPGSSNLLFIKNNGLVAYIEATSITSIQDHQACINNSMVCIDQKPSLESPELIKQDADALNNVNIDNGHVTSNLLDVVDHIEDTSAGESVYDPIAIEELEENSKVEGVEERAAERKSATEVDIEKLKEEIASIHARVKELESLAEVRH